MERRRITSKGRQWLRSLLSMNSTGSTAVSLAVALPAVLAGVGLATDYGLLEMKRTHLQNVADQTAISAVKELSLANTKMTSVASVADNYARAMVEEEFSVLSVDVSVNEKDGSVGVVLKEQWTPFFAHFLSADVTPIVVNASAKLVGRTNLCVLALDPTGMKPLHMDKSAKMQANGCAVYSNSSNKQAIRLDAESELTAALVCAVGGVKAKTSAIQPSPTLDCPVVTDPLSSREPKKSTVCDYKNTVLKTGAHFLKKGRYCGGLKIVGDANVTFEDGDYTISDGEFRVSDNASVQANNAAFYLEGEKSTLQFVGSSKVALSGAKDGPLAGLLFFEDRTASLGRTHRINSLNATELTGTIYLPRGKLRVDPNSPVAQDSAYTAIVAYQIEIDEGPTLVLNSNYGDTNVPVPDSIRFGAQVVLSE